MLELLAHRGPDGEDCWFGRRSALGVRRLAIVDEETESGVFALRAAGIRSVCNGEIYNYRDLVRNLESADYRFRTRCDTEVIPALYCHYGESFLDQINGMFGLAIYDSRRRTLFLARDRFGQKPLYWTEVAGTVYFASEMKAILTVPGAFRGWDYDALAQYLYLGQVFSPRTPFKNILSLPAGTWIKCSERGIQGPRTYFKPGFGEKDYQARRDLPVIDEMLRESVKLRMMGDRPVAGALSGGIDSATIMYYLKRFQEDETRSFGITFSGDDRVSRTLDERIYQDVTVEKLGLDLTRLDFSDVEEDLGREIPFSYWIYEYPDSVVQQEVVFKFLAGEMHRTGYRAALGGEGADELLGGYEWYDPATRFINLSTFEPVKGGSLERALAFDERWFLERWGYPALLFTETLSWENLQRLFDTSVLYPEFLDSTRRGPSGWDFSGFPDRSYFQELPANRVIQAADICMRMPDYILRVQDRFSMASSVEFRSPFLDRNLSDWFLQRNPEQFRRGGVSKICLRQLMRNKLPDKVLKRKKQGHSAPWLETEYDFGDARYRKMLSKRMLVETGVFNPDFVRRLKQLDTHLKRLKGRRPNCWLASRETRITVPELFLDRVAEIQTFAEIFGLRFEEYRDQHRRRYCAAC